MNNIGPDQEIPTRGDRVHMLGFAAVCWAIWKARNAACFDKKLINNPNKIFFCLSVYALLGRVIPGSHPGDDQYRY
jgi:hypothetical protein